MLIVYDQVKTDQLIHRIFDYLKERDCRSISRVYGAEKFKTELKIVIIDAWQKKNIHR